MYDETGGKGDGTGLYTDAGNVLYDIRYVERNDQPERLPKPCKGGQVRDLRQGRQFDQDVRAELAASAVSEFKSALPSGRYTVYTGNNAVRDYLEEYGYYDYYHQGVDIGGGARAYEFTAWEKM